MVSKYFLLLLLGFFFFIPSYAESGSINVSDYDVSYEIDNGEILTAYVDVDFVELVIDLVTIDDGILEIKIPRGLLDSKLSQNEDDIFFVILDGFETEYLELDPTASYRTLLIPFFSGSEQLEIIGTHALTQELIQIPSWIKNNARWWSEGQIDDNTFVQGIQYLITNGIMTIPSTQSGQASNEPIPSWIKNNARWWSEGQIDDNTFVQGIQYLINKGIIVV